MRRKTAAATFTAALLGLSGAGFGQGDPATVARIIDEGQTNSRVWEYLTYLSEEIGPRLTGSSRAFRANAWTRDVFAAHGLQARMQKWGEIAVGFDRGPSSARMVEPGEREFEFTSRAWSSGTDGPLRGIVLKEPRTMEELEGMRDQLEGAWILGKGRARGRRRGVVPEGTEPDVREEINQALLEAGIAGKILARRGELVVTGGQRGWRELDYDNLPDEVAIYVRRSDYDAMNSRLADGEQVVVEVDLEHHWVPGPLPVYNTVAEIRGTEWPEQVVIVSAHLDSWDGPGSQGTQDNGTGSAVTLEAARILSAADARPRRTIRFILWTGEEQGLLGSRAYVESLSEEERANISAVFVDDGGTNYQGGLVCVQDMGPALEQATAAVTEAFPDKPVEIRVRERMPRGGGSDHVPFNRAGIPGFFWIESGVGGKEGRNYRYIHHTQHDTMRYPIEEYLVQAATCSAVTAYNLAMADELLPRYVPSEESSEPGPEPRDERPFTVVTGPLTGRWKATLVGEDVPEDSDFTLSFEMSDDGQVRGTIDSRLGLGPVRDARFDPVAKTLAFRYRSEMMGRIQFNATLEGERMSGTIVVEDGFTMRFQAVRQPAEPPAAAAEVSAASPR